MANSQVATPTVHIPTFIPLVEAAQKYNLSEKALTQLIQTGKIEAVQLPTGELLVAAEKNGQKLQTKEQIIQEQYASLMKRPITVSEAAEKYDITRTTIIRWKDKGYITVLESGYQMTLDEAEVAYCADIYKSKKESGLGYRGPLLDKNGLPYELKREKLALYRRRKRNNING